MIDPALFFAFLAATTALMSRAAGRSAHGKALAQGGPRASGTFDELHWKGTPVFSGYGPPERGPDN